MRQEIVDVPVEQRVEQIVHVPKAVRRELSSSACRNRKMQVVAALRCVGMVVGRWWSSKPCK